MTELHWLTAAEAARAIAARTPVAGRADAGAARADRTARPEAQRLHPARRRRGDGRRATPPTPRSQSAACAARCTACRSASRTSSTSPGCRPPAIPRSWSTTSRRPTPCAWRGCAPPARSSSASCRRTSSPSAGRASTCPSRRRAIRGTRDHHPGGSSSGSGAGVAAGLFPLALGTDTGGSVRNPASGCGIVGLKPTYGLVSRRGVFPLAFTLDHVGPMTRTVADNALLLEVIAGHDPADPGSAASAGAAISAGAGPRRGRSAHRLRASLPRDRHAGATRRSRRRWRTSRACCRRRAREVRTVTLPTLDEFAAVNRVILQQRGVVDPRALAARAARRLRPAHSPPPDAGRLRVRRRLCRRQRRRAEMIAAVEDTLREVDVLLCASSMDPPSGIEDAAATGRTYPRQARTPFNVTGHPALAMMSGLSRERAAALGAIRRPLFRGRDRAARRRCLGARQRRPEASANRVNRLYPAVPRAYSPVGTQEARPMAETLVIRGGTVVDGTGRRAVRGRRRASTATASPRSASVAAKRRARRSTRAASWSRPASSTSTPTTTAGDLGAAD